MAIAIAIATAIAIAVAIAVGIGRAEEIKAKTSPIKDNRCKSKYNQANQATPGKDRAIAIAAAIAGNQSRS